MSLYIVDGDDLKDVADSIREKSEGSSNLSWPAGYLSEIEKIPGSLYGVSSISVGNPGTGDTLVAKLPDLVLLTLPTANNSTMQKIDIQSDKVVTISSSCSSTNKGGALKEIDLHGGKARIGTGSSYGVRYRENLEKINAKCIVITTNTSNQFTGATKLETIYFQENAQQYSVDISACPLSDASLVSLANGLSDDPISSTLTLSAACKATAQSMLGNVSTVIIDSVSCDIFTPDADGVGTLAQFITIDKGWTIA